MLSLTYVSSTKEILEVPELVELLTSIRPKNDERGLTGMLLYSGGNVIQTLEGPEESVDSVFSAIEQDPRHTGILVLLREQVDTRAFPEWSMGFRNVGDLEVHDITGYTDFTRRSFADGLGSHASSAYRLLELFRDNMR
ncbi:BLUF domain-containing protein [Nocardioides sp. URHA0020]|uniref:BLUF domain-containing protein n=1 Tax=Nocardioides sp. URHA0020 TaxID=1380392 RepID=UPI000685405E|nr:BLUF domain-containing protein [Nocardioides sp. URHA0020]